MRRQIESVRDYRQRPRIGTRVALSGALVMALSQLGSLNALEQTGKRNRFWHDRWIDGHLPSAETIGNVATKLACSSVRGLIQHVYTRLKRNKALKPFSADMFVLVLDGHESSCSDLLHCPGCLQRTLHTHNGDKTQYYHRHVMAQLVCGDFCLPLDMEPQRPGEGEVAAAIRLFKRVIANYPRAFSLVLADGLYLKANFFKLVLKHGKDAIAVLKDDRRDLLKDAQGLFKVEPFSVHQSGRVKRECWDIEHFTSWPQLGREVRVVRSLETSYRKGRKNVSDWIWAGTISKDKLPTEQFIDIAHGRWKIENNGFNELVNYWHADHVYRHDPTAIEVFWLLTMLAYMLFHAFINCNLKPAIRDKYTKSHLAKIIAAELYIGITYAVAPP